jgi:hypothetical protein
MKLVITQFSSTLSSFVPFPHSEPTSAHVVALMWEANVSVYTKQLETSEFLDSHETGR